jgi:argininosuccinate synthase
MKTILAYSGGLDTSVCIRQLQDAGQEVVTLTLELGQGTEDLKAIEEKAKKLGAVATYSIDVRDEFFKGYISKAIKANGLYEGKYPLGTAIGRPLIAKYLVDIARKEGADAVAHGSTGKGNDQVRFDVSVKTLNPKLKIIAPIREHWMSREEAVDYANKHGIPVDVTKKKIYSIDENLWTRSCEGGPLENPMNEPSEDCFKLSVSPDKAPDKPTYVAIGFEKGIPVSLNGKKMGGVGLITELNKLAGKNGVGRIDMMEDRVVGIKSREVYECPSAVTLIEVHKDLESLVLTREQKLFKENIDSKWAQMAYMGQWYEPLMENLNVFIESTQAYVTGNVKVKLFKGNAIVVGRESPYSLYDAGLATYDTSDTFDHKSAEGFIKLWGLPSVVAGKRKK